MEQFLEKFGIFDIFCMLIPGAMFVMGMAFLFPNAEEYIPDILTDGAIKYFSFFVVSYLCGVLYHEIGKIADDLAGHFIGKLDENYFKDSSRWKNKRLDFKLSKKVKQRILKKCFKSKELKSGYTEEEQNRFAIHYCLTVLETEGVIGKAEKMYSISEMSRSMFWMCLTLIFVYLTSRKCNEYNFAVLSFMAIAAIVFLRRKMRFEGYRVDIMMRNYHIYDNKKIRK